MLTNWPRRLVGWTYTGLTRGNATSKPDGAWEASQVADYLYQKMGEGVFGTSILHIQSYLTLTER